MQIEKNRLYSPREVIVANGGILPLSLSAVYSGMARGEIKSKTIGKRKMIPGGVLLDLVGYSNGSQD